MKKITYNPLWLPHQQTRIQRIHEGSKETDEWSQLRLPTWLLTEDAQSSAQVSVDHAVWWGYQVRGVPNHGPTTFYVIILERGPSIRGLTLWPHKDILAVHQAHVYMPICMLFSLSDHYTLINGLLLGRKEGRNFWLETSRSRLCLGL